MVPETYLYKRGKKYYFTKGKGEGGIWVLNQYIDT
jgi:hypothetical protein